MISIATCRPATIGTALLALAGALCASVSVAHGVAPTPPEARFPCTRSTERIDVCHAAGFDFESVVFNPSGSSAPLPLVIALHWSSSSPTELVRAMGPQIGRFRMIVPHARIPKRGGHSFFPVDFYDRPLRAQHLGVRTEAARLAAFIRAVQTLYRCPGPVVVTGVSQGGDLSFQLAHDHPQLVAASFPVLGRNLVGRSSEWRDAAPVTAYFSLDDPIVDRGQASAAVQAIRESHGQVQVREYFAGGHDLTPEMAAALADDLASQVPSRCAELRTIGVKPPSRP